MGQGYWKLNNKIVLEEIFMVEFLATNTNRLLIGYIILAVLLLFVVKLTAYRKKLIGGIILAVSFPLFCLLNKAANYEVPQKDAPPYKIYAQIDASEHTPYVYVDGSVIYYVLDYSSRVDEDGNLIYSFVAWDGEKNIVEPNFIINNKNIVKETEHNCNRITTKPDGTRILEIKQ